MKKFMIGVIIFISGITVFAQQLAVAISPFELRGGFVQADADVIYELFVAELKTSGAVKVVDQTSFDKTLSDMKFQAADWADSQKVLRLGAALNVSDIIQGQLMVLGGKFIITSSILEINTAKILSSPRLQLDSMDEIFNKMPDFVKSVVRNLPSPMPIYTKIYKIGETGPAGGIVFFDKGVIEEGWRYMEALPYDLASVSWGASGINVSGDTKYDVGRGKQNTRFIIDRLKEQSESGKAAQLCVNLTHGGCNDWFLPSSGELNLLFQNLHKKKLGGFQDDWYWSSSQYSRNGAWGQDFSDGRQYNGHAKANMFGVRPIRTF